MLPPHSLEQTIHNTVQEEWGRILAALVSSLRDFQLAEDCLQDAVVAAIKDWGQNGLPKSPAAWLITTARRRAIDVLRRRQNFASKQGEISYLLDLQATDESDEGMGAIPDKQLEMIFTCCHPALEEKTKLALTLRTLGGLSCTEIAAAFLDSTEAMQKRLTRAKTKIAKAGIPYKIPESGDLPERLGSVLHVLYLIFNEGYSANSGATALRVDLSNEAIRLTRIMARLMPHNCEVRGLLALMLLHDSRRSARAGPEGQMIALEHQNRARWRKDQISEGVALLHNILPQGQLGPYQVQAAISAVHAQAHTWEATDWDEITALYDVLYGLQPSPIVRLNHAVALSYAKSPAEGLAVLQQIEDDPLIARYQHFHAAKADMLARLGQASAARAHFQTAIELSGNDAERAFLKAKQKALS